MWIVNLTANPNGSHNDHRADHITTVPEGWAMIPDGFQLPASFPFGEITAEEKTYTREVEVQKEVTKTLEVPRYDDEGNMLLVMVTEEYTELETVMETREYTMMTVTAMSEGVVPPAPEPEPTEDEKRDAQIFYTAMMTDTLLEEV